MGSGKPMHPLRERSGYVLRVTKAPRFSRKLAGASTRWSSFPSTSASTARLAILTASSPSKSFTLITHTNDGINR
ncbi:MAG: hypothetical protein A4E31_00477 [Methanomassiliicoccales archaeon PtaU1.Bin030]|nr:MAG: hypothetical protein A4E31_00477 [Methanomassiliicoccales archaeon PtaU1.Bin030]